MTWLSNLFATRRELKRLAASEKFWRGKAETLEKEVSTLNETVREVYSKSFDRFLTGVVKTYAIGDEVKRSVSREPVIDAHQQDVSSFLLEKRAEYSRQARDAGKSEAEAEFLFNQDKEILISEFENQENFY